MENIFKGWFTTLLGIIIMISAIVHGFGWYHFPSPSVLSKPVEVLTAFLVGVVLFFVRYSKIESFVEAGLFDAYTFVKTKLFK